MASVDVSLVGAGSVVFGSALNSWLDTYFGAPWSSGHLPDSTGSVVSVSTVSAWQSAVNAATSGTIIDVAAWCAAMVAVYAGTPVGRFVPDVAERFITDAPLPGAAWRLGWDTPSTTPGVSQAGDRWPRTGAVGHTGFTGTSIWLDLAHRRWVVLLTNRVHPTRHGTTADRIKALRRAIHDAAMDALPA